MSLVARIGLQTREKIGGVTYLFAVIHAVLRVAARRRYWTSPVRNVLARQILFTGYEATRFVSLIALLVGVSVVVQTQVWLRAVGQTALLGPVLVMVLVREIGPLLANLVVIGRSGTAMATEMANMKINGEVRLLDGLGLDPFVYLLLPRVLGAAVSIFCLTVVFILVSFVSGYASGVLLGVQTGDPGQFVHSVFGALRPADVLNLLAKSLLPGLLMGTICCTEGLSVQSSITEVPQAATRAVVRSTAALFITSALVSLITYI